MSLKNLNGTETVPLLGSKGFQVGNSTNNSLKFVKMVVVSDESLESVQYTSYMLPPTSLTSEPPGTSQTCTKTVMILVSGTTARIPLRIHDPDDDGPIEKVIKIPPEVKCSQIYQAVSISHKDDEHYSVNSFKLSISWDNGHMRFPFECENKYLSKIGMLFDEKFDNYILSVKRQTESNSSENSVDTLEPLLELQTSMAFNSGSSSIIPITFLISPTTTVQELYHNIVHIRRSHSNSMRLQHSMIDIFFDNILYNKTFQELGLDFENMKIETLQLDIMGEPWNTNYEALADNEQQQQHQQQCSKNFDEYNFHHFNSSTSKPPSSNNASGKMTAIDKFFHPNYINTNNNNKKLSTAKDQDTSSVKKSSFNFDKANSSEWKTTIYSPQVSYVGLVNQAMTCYLNSLLQALYMTPEFRNALYNWEYIDGSEKYEAKSIPYQLQKLFLNLQTSSKTAVETTSLTKSFGWDSTEAWQQHDIQELCRVMFDALEQKFKNTDQADLINRLYEGKMIDYVKCLSCKTEKSREDTFLDIPLPVRPFDSNVAYQDVQEALKAFVQPETLDGVNQYHCETCNKKSDAHKGLKFTKFPYLLTLHLKRFDFDYNTFQRIKLNDKVAFPDILNLNFLIPENNTEGQDSPSLVEEDAGVGVKCNDDSCTTDSANSDECLPSPIENGGVSSLTEMINNHKQSDIDDDEGIDMSNGPSTSTNHSLENKSRRLRSKGGPYEYELFSIMIHSGSASGGHYYAYIKDFKTQKWLCFNDQNVSPITREDIQKTFGGGTNKSYYSGAYSSSTNAYMLMYRQIDSERNCLPMEVENFPKHIQELLEKMIEQEEEKRREKMPVINKIKVTVIHPIEGIHKVKKIYCIDDDTLEEILEKAHKDLELENVVPLEQCRLVTWNSVSEFIVYSFEGEKQKESIVNIYHQHMNEESRDLEMLLEIREKDEVFQNYPPGEIGTIVYLVDMEKKIVETCLDLRVPGTETFTDFKQRLGKLFNKCPKSLILILTKYSTPSKIINDDYEGQLRDDCGLGCRNKFFVGVNDNPSANLTTVQSALLRLIDEMEDLIYLIINLPNMSKEILEEMNIPTLQAATKLKEIAARQVITSSTLSSSSSSSSSNVQNQKKKINEKQNSKNEEGKEKEKEESTVILGESDEWHEPQSNSEDSSLSDSDRTLVGGDVSEDDDDFLDIRHTNENETNFYEGDSDRSSSLFFKYIGCNDDKAKGKKCLKVVVNRRTKLSAFKKNIEPHVGIPVDCFKILSQYDTVDSFYGYTRGLIELTHYNDGSVMNVKLCRALGANEIKIKVYQMMDFDTIASGTIYEVYVDLIISKDATIGQLRQTILNGIKKRDTNEIPANRLRLRKKNCKKPSQVLLDDDKVVSAVGVLSQAEIIMQLLNEDETVTDPDQVVVMVRCYSTITNEPSSFQEIVLSSASLIELRDKVAQLSGIPLENLEFANSKWPPPNLMGRIPNHCNLQWTTITDQPSSSQPLITLDDSPIIFYKDTAELETKCKKQLSEDSFNWTKSSSTHRDRRLRENRTPVPANRKREQALKIYVDDK